MEEFSLTKNVFLRRFLPKVDQVTAKKFQKLGRGKKALIIAKAIFSKPEKRRLALGDMIHKVTEPAEEAEDIDKIAEDTLALEEEELSPEEEEIAEAFENEGFSFSIEKTGPLVLVDTGLIIPEKQGGSTDGFFKVASRAASRLSKSGGSDVMRSVKQKLASQSVSFGSKSGGRAVFSPSFQLSDQRIGAKIVDSFSGKGAAARRESASLQVNVSRYKALAQATGRPIALHVYSRGIKPTFKNKVILIAPKGVSGKPIAVAAANAPQKIAGHATSAGSSKVSTSPQFSGEAKKTVKALPWARLVAPLALMKIGPGRPHARPVIPKGMKMKGKGGGKKKKIKRSEKETGERVEFETTGDIFSSQKQTFSDMSVPAAFFDAAMITPGKEDGFFQIADELGCDWSKLSESLKNMEIDRPENDEFGDIYAALCTLDFSSRHLDQALIEQFPGKERRKSRMIASTVVNVLRYRALSEALDRPVNLFFISRGDEGDGPSSIPIPFQETLHEGGLEVTIPTYPKSWVE